MQDGNGDRRKITNVEDGDARNIVRQGTNTGKVIGYESEYIESSDLGSYDETIEDSIVENTKRHRSCRKIYEPNVPLDDFFLDLRFKDLKMFKSE